MGPIDVVAIVILIVAILVLVYYYLQNNPASVQKLRNYVPATADPHMGEILQNDSDYDDLSREKDTVEESKEESMSKRIKIKLSDIDMSGLNTDAFSNKIDAFLDEKSELEDIEGLFHDVGNPLHQFCQCGYNEATGEDSQCTEEQIRGRNGRPGYFFCADVSGFP